jgi:hypothetical protein
MALGFYFVLTGMTAEKYDECIKRLNKAGAQHPAGRTYHASFGTRDKLSVFDVWTSQAAFDKFGKTLMPILQEIWCRSRPAERDGDPQRDYPASESAAGEETHHGQACRGASARASSQATVTPDADLHRHDRRAVGLTGTLQ